MSPPPELTRRYVKNDIRGRPQGIVALMTALKMRRPAQTSPRHHGYSP